uniref:Uncharacterized protein n=1 Tax=Arundo donax TaxID=35708 RepID=A0A0A9BSY3_ARUDO
MLPFWNALLHRRMLYSFSELNLLSF